MSLTSLDLNLLHMLSTVLTEKSVARAADRLHVTPSAISNALARLRQLIGDPLVIRKGRGIVPTPRALELAPILKRALAELDQAVRGGAFEAATTTRQFTLALADVGQVVRVPRLAPLFAREFPKARLRVIGIDSLVSLGGLAGTEVDLVIGVSEDGAGVRREPLFEEHTVLCARRGHPRAPTVSVDDLAGLRHVAVQMVPGRDLRDLAGTRYAKAGVPRELAMVVPSFTAAAAVVAATDWVATLPTSLFELLAPRLNLIALKGPIPPVTAPMMLCWHERTQSDPGMAAFRELVRRALAAEITAPPARRARRAR